MDPQERGKGEKFFRQTTPEAQRQISPPCAARDPTTGKCKVSEKPQKFSLTSTMTEMLNTSYSTEAPLQQQLDQQKQQQTQLQDNVHHHIRAHPGGARAPAAAAPMSNSEEAGGLGTRAATTPRASRSPCNAKDTGGFAAAHESPIDSALNDTPETEPTRTTTLNPGPLSSTDSAAADGQRTPREIQFAAAPSEHPLGSCQQAVRQIVPDHPPQLRQSPPGGQSVRSPRSRQAFHQQAESPKAETPQAPNQKISDMLRRNDSQVHPESNQRFPEPAQSALPPPRSQKAERPSGSLTARILRNRLNDGQSPSAKQPQAPDRVIKSLQSPRSLTTAATFPRHAPLGKASRPSETARAPLVTTASAGGARAASLKAPSAKAANARNSPPYRPEAQTCKTPVDAALQPRSKYSKAAACGSLAAPGKAHSSTSAATKSTRGMYVSSRLHRADERLSKAASAPAPTPRAPSSRSNITDLCSSSTTVPSHRESKLPYPAAAGASASSKATEAQSQTNGVQEHQPLERRQHQPSSVQHVHGWQTARRSLPSSQRSKTSELHPRAWGAPQVTPRRVPQGATQRIPAKVSNPENSARPQSLPLGAPGQSSDGTKGATESRNSPLRRPLGLPLKAIQAGAPLEGRGPRGSMTARASIGSNAAATTRQASSIASSRLSGCGVSWRTERRGFTRAASQNEPTSGPDRGATLASQAPVSARRRPLCSCPAVSQPPQAGPAASARSGVRGRAATTAAPSRSLGMTLLRSGIGVQLPGSSKSSSRPLIAATTGTTKRKQAAKASAAENQIQAKIPHAGSGSGLTNAQRGPDAGTVSVPAVSTSRVARLQMSNSHREAGKGDSSACSITTPGSRQRGPGMFASRATAVSRGSTELKASARSASLICERPVQLPQQCTSSVHSGPRQSAAVTRAPREGEKWIRNGVSSLAQSVKGTPSRASILKAASGCSSTSSSIRQAPT